MATALPKAELHCHLKGTIAPALAQTLAARHGENLGGLIGADGRYAWRDFAGFLAAYDAVAALVKTPDDYRDVLRDYYARAAADGLIYGEVFISPAHAAQAGISYPLLLDTLADAVASAERDFGVVVRLILIAVRHWGAAGAEQIASLAQKTPHPLVVGFGMGGDEAHGAPADFARAFAIARDAGLRTTCHAGEVLGPDSVRQTLAHLKVDRIGHGVRAIEDESLLTELKDRGTFLEVCPGSNIALGLYPSYAAHPLTRLAGMGIACGISTDDPGFFADSIGAEYARVADAHPQTDMAKFTRMSLQASFCDDATKARLGAP